MSDELQKLKQLENDLTEQKKSVQLKIDKLEAEEEKKKEIALRGLIARIRPIIEDQNLVDVFEKSYYESGTVDAYGYEINVEVSGRITDGTAYDISLDKLKDTGMIDDPTLVISFLIPFDMVSKDEYFND